MTISPGPILVVEDIPTVLELLDVTLRYNGYTVLTAHNGQEAVEIIKKTPPVLLITDILMPRLDGFSLAQQVRTDPATHTIPIIFLSAAYVTPEDKIFAHSLGAILFMEKPVDTEDFLLTIAEVLAQGVPETTPTLSEDDFYKGYRERLEMKLQHKNNQIARTERLLQTLSTDQRPAYQALLDLARHDRDEIQKELNQLYIALDGN